MYLFLEDFFVSSIASIFSKTSSAPIELWRIQRQNPFIPHSTLKDVVKKTRKNKKIIVNLAINYGSRDEIVNACKKTKGKISIRSLSKNFYTKSLPNPDILIRTGGHKRLSNFMLWQLAYTEIYFIDKLWPDFNGRDFEKIINDFKKVKRNFGSI